MHAKRFDRILFDDFFNAIDQFILEQAHAPDGPEPVTPADGQMLRALLQPTTAENHASESSIDDNQVFDTGNPFGSSDVEGRDGLGIFEQAHAPTGLEPVTPADGQALRALLQPSAFENQTSVGSDATFVDYQEFNMGNPFGGGGSGGGGGGRPGGGGGDDGGGDGGGGGSTVEATYTSGTLDTGFDDTINVDTNRGTSDPFNFQIEFVGNGSDWNTSIATTIQGYVEAAAEFLSSVIAYGFTDDDNGLKSDGTEFVLDDLYVEVKLETGALGGEVASANIYAANDWDGNGTAETPAGATLTIDLADAASLDALGVLDDTILHEMIHALGFGTLWDVAGNDLTTKSKGNLVYTGTEATTLYGDNIPAEGGGGRGTYGGHWDEAALDAELMTGIVEQTDTMYLADFSLASLEDLGIYELAVGWEGELDALNGSNATGDGIDLMAWYDGFLTA